MITKPEHYRAKADLIDMLIKFRVKTAKAYYYNSGSIFGDGSDGTLHLTGTIALNRDMHYSRLTISATGEIITNGYRVFSQSMTIHNGGTIKK